MLGLVKIYVLVTNSTKHVSDNAALFIKMYIRRSASMQMYCNINYSAIKTFLHMLVVYCSFFLVLAVGFEVC